MEPEVKIVDRYFQECKNFFTMTNRRVKGNKEIDLLAFNPKTNEVSQIIFARVNACKKGIISFGDTFELQLLESQLATSTVNTAPEMMKTQGYLATACGRLTPSLGSCTISPEPRFACA